MAKKRQSTGLPKPRPTAPTEGDAEQSKGKRPAATGTLGEQKSRREQEQETLRTVLFWSVAALAVVGLIIAFVFVRDQIINPSRSVASVNGDSISVTEFQRRVRMERAFINEQVSASASQLINLGFVADPNDAINQLYQFDPTIRGLIDDLGTSDRLGLRVLNTMIEDKLIEQEAARLGITVTDEDIDREVRRFLEVAEFDPFDPFSALDDPVVIDLEVAAEGTPEPEAEPTASPTPLVSPTPSATPTEAPTSEVSPTPTLTPFPSPTPTEPPTEAERQQTTEAQVAEFYRAVGRDAGVSRNDIRAVFRVRALRNAIAEQVLEVPTASIWVNARHILVSSEDEARDIIDAISAGESFAAIARVMSEDTGSGSRGGELDWNNTANFVDGFREAVREQEVGLVSAEPVESDFGFHIIQVRDREEREIEEAEINRFTEEGMSDWVVDLRARPENEISTSNFWPDVVPNTPGFTFRQR